MAKDVIDVKTIEAAYEASGQPLALPPREAELIRNALGLLSASLKRAINAEKDLAVKDLRLKAYNEVLVLISRIS